MMAPNASGKIPSNLEMKIDEDLGGIEKMISDFINAGVTQFGSGWCWLELKDWKFCAFYHKLTRVDKIDGFQGNEYTAFGSAMHSVCEKKLLNEEVDSDFFVKELKKNIAELPEDLEIALEERMEEFEDEIISVDYILNIREISTDIQSTTDETLKNL